jgi:hypothetical protein
MAGSLPYLQTEKPETNSPAYFGPASLPFFKTLISE